MIAPIREAEPSARRPRQTTDEVRRLVASFFLDETRSEKRPLPAVPHWKAWLLIAWAIGITIVYLAAMIQII